MLVRFWALKAIEISVRAPTYRGIGVKIRVPTFWMLSLEIFSQCLY